MSKQKTKVNGRDYDITTETVRINNEPVTYPVVTEHSDHTTELTKLLKAIYNDGAYGTKRSLQDDLDTLKGLL